MKTLKGEELKARREKEKKLLQKLKILEDLKKYNITENNIKNDFTDFLYCHNLDEDNDVITYEDVDEYLEFCYYDVFSHLDDYELNCDIMILKDEIISEIETIIYDDFNICDLEV